MFKVTFSTKDSRSRERGHEVYFESEVNANVFYDDLENFINEKSRGDSCVVYKSSPEKSNPIHLYWYDQDIKSLRRVN